MLFIEKIINKKRFKERGFTILRKVATKGVFTLPRNVATKGDFMLLRNVDTEGGFTLIELMVVLVIIIILAIYGVGGYRDAAPRLSLERTVESFIRDVDNVKNRSFSSVAYEDSEDNIVRFNHGIFIEEGESYYTIFIDEDGNNQFTSTNDSDIQNIDKNVQILEVSDGTDLSIVFNRDGEVYFNGELAEGSDDDVSIIFSIKGDDTIQSEVKINHRGVTESHF